jgi:cell wall-associated NlpC family hydrolase
MFPQASIAQHSLECYPSEACGIVVGDQYVPCDNLSETPTLTFVIDPVIVATHDVQYIVHSHTRHFGEGSNVDPRTPSIEDMQGQIDTDLPWAIVYCDGKTVTPALTFGDIIRPPLEGRKYAINVNDCLTLATDYYALHGVQLPSIARAIDWNEQGQDLINENMAAWGFTPVRLDEAKKNDLVLFKLPRSQVSNHIGVYLGDNKVLHQLYGRLSCIEEISTFTRYIDKVVRHEAFK